MRNLIIFFALLTLFSLLLLWSQGVEEPTEMMALSRLADEMMKEIKEGEVNRLSFTLEEIQERLLTYPAYLYPQGKLPSILPELVAKVQEQVWLRETDTDRFMEDAFILYTLMDMVAHPYQPVWLEMLKEWGGRKVPLKQYAYIRPAMLLSLPTDQVARFDQYFTDSSDGGDLALYRQLVREAMDVTQERMVSDSRDLFFTLFLFLITALSFIALRMRFMNGDVHESGSYWHRG